MKKLSKYLLLVAALVLCVVLLPTEIHAAEVVESGTCGDNLTWTLDAEGTLTISGTGEMAYYNNNSIYSPWHQISAVKKVIIDDGVTYISDYAFYGCARITDVEIGDSITVIGNSAFYGCSNLSTVYYKGLQADWDSIFFMSGNDSLLNANIICSDNACKHSYNSTITKAPTCKETGIKTYTCTVCGDSYTEGVAKLTTHNYAVGVCTICGENDPAYVPPKEPVIVASGTCGTNLSWTLDDKGTLVISGTGTMTNYDNYNSPWYYKSSVKTIIIEDGVTTIGSYAFNNCKGLTSVEIPNSVTAIGEFAFSYSTSLTSVIIPDSVTAINRSTFWGCHSLTSVTIPNSVTTIGAYAFSWCTSLTGITIPDSVTAIGEGAFYYSTSLTNVYYKSTQAKWERIAIETNNEPLLNAEIVFNDCAHSYDNGVETEKPTCGKVGIKTFTCAACGDSYTEEIAKLTTHNYIDGTCTVCGGSDPDYAPPVNDSTAPSVPAEPGTPDEDKEGGFFAAIAAFFEAIFRVLFFFLYL